MLEQVMLEQLAGATNYTLSNYARRRATFWKGQV